MSLNIDDAAEMFGGIADYTQTNQIDSISDDGMGSHGGDDDDEENEVEMLRKQWVNEVASPSLLPIDVDLVECLILLLKNQLAVIDQLEENVSDPMSALQLSMYQTEVDRVKYILVDYLRVRLRKIERNALWYLSQFPDGKEYKTNGQDESITITYLSPKEMKFCLGYSKLLRKHMNETVLKHMPSKLLDNKPELDLNLQKLDDMQTAKMIDPPPDNTYVLAKMISNGSQWISNGDGDEPDFSDYRQGHMILARYDAIKARVVSKEIELVP
mmetsp:Transcript_13446/g.27440  ORF Transcript_13446/g.27440 Transcript_13446/m.27440 type:complete len:271 (+) Transcript_13446:203-1015(+)|eukprot:CAMPEP_0118640024 /NCGR_PEP_ID=MMETSP0785-20121206/4536_1 /TAXON_ID=91992 /ORGANISM="Bolidomonas pacifica, Strain CCMP 1866" /LENGTH=270 /DNA_ID=CAMNT_0006531391 /DNA_START=123 /DNA_END=935 /DNA_ORIENTATION=+